MSFGKSTNCKIYMRDLLKLEWKMKILVIKSCLRCNKKSAHHLAKNCKYECFCIMLIIYYLCTDLYCYKLILDFILILHLHKIITDFNYLTFYIIFNICYNYL